jgi:fructose-bisphosphate aldolase class II
MFYHYFSLYKARRDTMGLVSMKEMLESAKKGKYAVGQFNIMTLEFADTIAAVAEDMQSPLIFGAGEPTIRYIGIEELVAIARIAAEKVSVPVALHLDHGSSFEVAMKCIRAGFSSVMFDGSKYGLAENIQLTKKVVEAAHAVGVSVEGELGTIGGTEDDIEVADEAALLADPDEAIHFWQETQVDALAIAVGTAHGLYKKEPKINFDTIQKVANSIKAPVVLHGGSGVPDQQIEEAIIRGIGKVNVNTENCVAYTKAVRNFLEVDKYTTDPRAYQRIGREAMQAVVREKIQLFGSSGKA